MPPTVEPVQMTIEPDVPAPVALPVCRATVPVVPVAVVPDCRPASPETPAPVVLPDLTIAVPDPPVVLLPDATVSAPDAPVVVVPVSRSRVPEVASAAVAEPERTRIAPDAADAADAAPDCTLIRPVAVPTLAPVATVMAPETPVPVLLAPVMMLTSPEPPPAAPVVTDTWPDVAAAPVVVPDPTATAPDAPVASPDDEAFMRAGRGDWVTKVGADGVQVVGIPGTIDNNIAGTVALIEHMRAEGALPDLCLVGEPTSVSRLGDMMKIGRRGSLTCHFEAQGVQGHSAYPHRAKNPLHAMVLGMIPDCPLEKVGSAGNAAGTGARIALLNGTARAEIEAVVGRIEKVETAIEPRFQEHFVNANAIPHAVDPFPNLHQIVSLPAVSFNPKTAGDEGGRRRRRG